MPLIMDATARHSLLNTLVRIVHVLNDVVRREPALAHRVRPVQADLERFLWVIDAPRDAVNVGRDLDRLVDSPGWQHPSQVLGAQGVDYETLIAACKRRRSRFKGRPRQRIEGVLLKLERAHRMAEEAWAVQLHQLKERLQDLVEALPDVSVDPWALEPAE